MSGARTAELEFKNCASCGRRMTRRRRWRDSFDAVRYCSDACRARKVNRVDTALEKAIMDLLARRARGASICPSEAARTVAGDSGWRDLMEPTRRAARRLVHSGKVELLQRGNVVEANDVRGPVRIRKTS